MKDKFKTDHSRRKFLQNSSALVGGVMLAGLPASSSAFVAGKDEIKIALIGCGGRGTGAASQALSTKANVKLVAMADAFRDRLDESYTNLKNMDGIQKRVEVPEDYKFAGFEAYKQAIDQADVVILATPPAFRPAHFEYAISRGKHVFMEKPVAVDAPGIRKVLEVAQQAKTKHLNVVVGLQRRFSKIYGDETVNLLHEGIIGNIVAASAYWNIGAIRMPQRKPGQTEMEYQMRNWYHFTWLSGDHIEDTHIHNLDVVNWVMQDFPVKAQGNGGRAVAYGEDKGQLFDHHSVEFEYGNGVRLNSQCRQISGTWVKLGEYFVGTKGVAETDTKHVIIRDHAGKELFRYRDRNDPNPQQLEHDVLFNAITSGKYINNAETGAKSTMTSILGRMASYSGQVVTWDEALNSNVSLYPQRLAWDAATPAMPGEDGKYPIPVPGQTRVL